MAAKTEASNLTRAKAAATIAKADMDKALADKGALQNHIDSLKAEQAALQWPAHAGGDEEAQEKLKSVNRKLLSAEGRLTGLEEKIEQLQYDCDQKQRALAHADFAARVTHQQRLERTMLSAWLEADDDRMAADSSVKAYHAAAKELKEYEKLNRDVPGSTFVNIGSSDRTRADVVRRLEGNSISASSTDRKL
jgi:hypothetical protein